MNQSEQPANIAYFSMEIGLDPTIPTYSGGLGVLAGDSLRAAADLRLPMVAITLVSRSGYFRQQLDAEGKQAESPDAWSPEGRLTEMPQRVSVQIEGRTVHLRAWRYMVEGCKGNDYAIPVPAYLLDADLPENDEGDRRFTDVLYGGDPRYRLIQETILGLGGVAMLKALGYTGIHTHHLNEGHSGLLALALLEEQLDGGEPLRPARRTESPTYGAEGVNASDLAAEPLRPVRRTESPTSGPISGWSGIASSDLAAVRQRCVFTVHTPVPAGHDVFPRELVQQVLGDERTALIEACDGFEGDSFDMTTFVMSFARSANGVSMRHGQVSRDMFPGHNVIAVTNGVHAGTWISDPIASVLDRHASGWRKDTRFLRYAEGIPPDEIRAAHTEAKGQLFSQIDQTRGIKLDPKALTIGFARRATGYKRGDLLFSDLPRLRRIVERAGPLQVVFSGKAHPRDLPGKEIIEEIHAAARELEGTINVIYLENYGMDLARYLVSGVDLWLNNPQKPLEASGTSGMKAAMNGVPSLSVLDGWWIEGHVEGATGWAIGDESPDGEEDEIASLYDKLEYAIMPMFYKEPAAYAAVMRHCIAVNGEFFSAQRMMNQYNQDVYQAAGEGF